MDKKITLFLRSLNGFSLIDYLIHNKLLACVCVADKKDADTHNLLQSLEHYKIPYFIYSENDLVTLDTLNKIDTNLAVIFGFPFKISQNIIDHFKENIYNIHASALPSYRGINPMFWQIRDGKEDSALVMHKLTQKFDEGDIVVSKSFLIDSQDTFGTLNGVVSQLTVSLLEEFLESFDNKLNASAQIGDISYSKEVEQSDILIDWRNMTSLEIYNLIRACNPIFGGAKVMWKNSMLSILESTIMDMNNLGIEAGTIIHIGSPEGLIVSTIDGTLRLDIISVPDGFFSGVRFANRFKLDVSEKLTMIKL